VLRLGAFRFPLLAGPKVRYPWLVTMHVELPDDLVKQIDQISPNRAAFVADAVKRLLRESAEPIHDEINRINDLSEELNREAEDVLEYQVIP
jgi:metal-responsive CopG/Arc/MetJ family transcriptional regulator